METAPILITGIPRSGSSMIAATINLCGAFGGEMSKRGMYCNDRIREELVKPYFTVVGADVDVLKDFPIFEMDPINWKDKVEKILSEQGYSGGPWMYKDSRLCQMWKVWDKVYPNAKWIIVRRRTGDIIESCLKTKYMKAHTVREGWLDMVHVYEKRFAEMVMNGLNCKVIWPERMVDGDYKQIQETIEWLGLTWDPTSLQYIETLLWGSRLKERRK
jgi:hypothetical protein